MMPICKFQDVSEHDMDMLFLEEFVISKDFLNIFTSKVNIDNASVVEIEHSKNHPEFGESDMTVIVEVDGKRHGLLIEDKIDAIAMPEQCDRYMKRGNLGVENGDYSSFSVFIVAPENYLENNAEARKYPNKVTYEECLKYFETNADARKNFKLSQIKQAIYKQKTGYRVIENKTVTDFWKRYIAYKKQNYDGLLLTATEGPKGSNATWPQFNTVIEKIYIIHKADREYVDLIIPGMAKCLPQLEMLLREMVNLRENNMTVHPTGKSAAVRLIVPKLDFLKSFDEQIEAVEKCFKAVEKLSETVKQLDVAKIRLFIENNKAE